MPTYKDDTGIHVIEFSCGDIDMSLGAVKDAPFDNEIVFINHGRPRTIGGSNPELIGKSTDGLATIARLIFTRRESLLVLQERVQTLLAQYPEDD